VGRVRWPPDEGAARLPRRSLLRKKRQDAERETDAEPDAEREGRTKRESTGQSGVRPGDAWIPARTGGRASQRHGSASRPVVGPGARVRVLEGPFAGRTGVVQELDGKGGARVMLGLLAVRVVLRDLVLWPGKVARPRLSSSHRRLPPARS
jgi:transcription antitermination factor NusG